MPEDFAARRTAAPGAEHRNREDFALPERSTSSMATMAMGLTALAMVAIAAFWVIGTESMHTMRADRSTSTEIGTDREGNRARHIAQSTTR